MTSCASAPTVIIIGAGASGIASATKLQENGIPFTILEAENRIGGRIHGVKFGDAVVDLGAQWSHGEQNNTMYEIIKHLDLLQSSNFRKHIHYSNDNFDNNIAEQLFKLCKTTFLNEKPDDAEESVGQFVTQKFYDKVKATFPQDDNILKRAEEILNSFRHDVLTQRGAFSWYNLSMLNNYDRLKGNVYLNFNGLGHGIVLDVMMKKYPNPSDELPISNKILFGKEVKEIFWDGDFVKVICTDQSEYFANHVIATMSLGVLKNHHDSIFKPKLPDDKIKAIEDLGMDAVVKIALHFPNKWWNDTDFQTALLCWDKMDLKKLSKEFPEGPLKDSKSWLENLYEFHIIEKNPQVLIAWFTGEFVPQIEILPDDLIINGITFVLKKFFANRYNVTKPDRILRHNWYSNPHFYGVYSYETVESRRGQEFGAAERLSKPLVSKGGKVTLLFGGEASSPTHYATVHGAIETGFREALRIVNMYK